MRNTFSIKDLENLSGIKAHTIRIWEKRYNVLEPMRTDTNIRLYDLESLQKLLNITLLHNHGYKISTISKYPEGKIPQLVSEIISSKSAKTHAISAFKIAMVNFDQNHFLETYNALLSEKTFSDIFTEVFIPFLQEIGMLWQTGTITPAQEHFICYLIKQKLVINIEKAQLSKPEKTDRTFVLYLPSGELHELGLMYINYELLMHGHQTIYLGQSIPMNNLKDLGQNFRLIEFVTYMTIYPDTGAINDYIKLMKKNILSDHSRIWITGKQTKHIDDSVMDSNIRIFDDFKDLLEHF
ncbi:MerR family transcriptional regulator [Flavobacterium noncentrifugens]|uniref:B12 binding domain-containing protein n=1 Tax=Flavobacterium noncentrifugens TaxID=1128970 RepID=A0A1G9CEZ3_9FLAO|nr:MerR family transcriptional regulator [Flavobacterium noncentrifugens]GEP52010.1 MerR family transcriptional regulator [Flavobacterium noncentrifugens]SDK50220.1 B12 binding domain-containing protein [Flavobacterium noncentrifugens]